MRGHLLDKDAPYPVANVKVFLQGSYGNATNIYADSDVDIVLKHTGAVFNDISHLPADQQARFSSESGGVATYGYTDFKADAEAYIKRLYNGVQVGKKAVHVPGNNGRRDADILICQELRRYTSYTPANVHYYDGVRFFSGNTSIDNFPTIHTDNCAAKNQVTGSSFKRMVRIFKNMRNTMIEKNLLAEGVAPSYFIEGMLSNVPNGIFAGSYEAMWVTCYNWIGRADETQLTTASDLHWLIRENAECWPSANFKTFMAVLKTFWES